MSQLDWLADFNILNLHFITNFQYFVVGGKIVSIKYLDYVIDKYLDVLDRASKGEFTLSARFYDFFIKNELTPTEY